MAGAPQGVADGTGPLLQHLAGGVTPVTVGGSTTLGTTVAGVKGSAGLGVADGSGPLLLHTVPTASVAGTAAAGAGAAASKAAVATKLAAISAAVGGVLGILLAGAAAAGTGYLGYVLVRSCLRKRPAREQSPAE